MDRISTMIYGCLASLLYCAYIVYDTDNLIKRYTYDEYIWAAVTLYVDIISLFLSLLRIFRAADSWDANPFNDSVSSNLLFLGLKKVLVC